MNTAHLLVKWLRKRFSNPNNCFYETIKVQFLYYKVHKTKEPDKWREIKKKKKFDVTSFMNDPLYLFVRMLSVHIFPLLEPWIETCQEESVDADTQDDNDDEDDNNLDRSSLSSFVLARTSRTELQHRQGLINGQPNNGHN